MSIVLEALEKAQREEHLIVNKEKKAKTPSSSITPVSEKIETPVTKVQRNPSKSGHKVYIVWFILAVGLINILVLSWWLRKNNSDISVNIPLGNSVPAKNILSPAESPKNTAQTGMVSAIGLPFDVTGIMWDEKEPIALVNGRFLKEGDELLGAKLINIEQHKVTFLYKDKDFTVSVQ